MLGDNYRRLQADELDAEWDRLVRNEHSSNGNALSFVAGEMSARIPAANRDAKSRVRQQLFAGVSRNAEMSSSHFPRSIDVLPTPVNAPRPVPNKRLWSSPMATFEVIAACLVIAALALGISAYQSGNDSGPSGRSFNAAESTPEPLPTPDWTQLRALKTTAQPTSTSWDGGIGIGRVFMNLSEVYFPVDTGYSVEYTGINLISVLSGTVTLTTDSGEPIRLTSGESASTYVNNRYSIRNIGSEMAYVIHGLVYQESAVATFSDVKPFGIDYYAYFLGNAVLDLPTDQAKISLEILNESTINREVQSDATELLLNQADPITIVVTDGVVGIRERGLGTTSEDYRTGGGYSPIGLGSTIVLSMDNTNVLAHPGATYSVSAPVDSDVLAISLRVESLPESGGEATPIAEKPGFGLRG